VDIGEAWRRLLRDREVAIAIWWGVRWLEPKGVSHIGDVLLSVCISIIYDDTPHWLEPGEVRSSTPW